MKAWGVLCLVLSLASLYGEEFTLQGEVRYRFEYKENFDFQSSQDDQDGIHLIRTRLNGAYQGAHGKIFFQLQDARVGALSVGSRGPYQDKLDIRQFYGELGNLEAKGWAIQVGRMELLYGDERLLGGFNWSNIAQSFEGLRLRVHLKGWQGDLFGVRKVIIQDGELNKWNTHDTLWGVWLTKGISRQNSLHLYGFYRDARQVFFSYSLGSGSLDEITLGFRWEGKKGGAWDYLLQGAYQLGDFGLKNIKAYAYILGLGYTFPHTPGLRWGVEYALGSGDGNPADNTRKTFDNLFPTNHKFYGYMDRVSLQNIRNLKFSLAMRVKGKIRMGLDYHLFRVDKVEDALYAASRKPIRYGQKGFNPSVGEEIDFTLKIPLDKHWKILFGYSHFHAGPFLEKTGGGDDGDFVYVQSSVTF